MVDHDLEYVNFESAYDGPVIEDPNSTVKVYLDKVVICESCVAGAARLLGMEYQADTRDHLAAIEAYCEQLEAEVKTKDRAISDLTHTVGTLIEHPVKRPAGKPQLRGPEDKEAQIKELRSNRARAEKVSKAKRKVAKKD